MNSQVQCEQSNHFIFEGSPGVGKRTMARALLREVFEPNMLEVSCKFQLECLWYCFSLFSGFTKGQSITFFRLGRRQSRISSCRLVIWKQICLEMTPYILLKFLNSQFKLSSLHLTEEYNLNFHVQQCPILNFFPKVLLVVH